MSTFGYVFDKIVLIILCLLCVFSLFSLIKWLIAYKTEKDKALVGSRESLIAGGICIVIFAVIFLVDALLGSPEPIYGIVALIELATLPVTTFSILTPKGICKTFSLKRKYVPVSELSYEFTDKYLAMYFNTTKKNNMVKYQIGINNMNTVKMLADWYPKHNMTNPLLPEGEDGDNTE